jgi:hypothetical protein
MNAHNTSQGCLFLISLLIFGFVYTGFTSTSPGSLTDQNRVFKTNIKSVIFYKEGFECAAPVIRLNSQDRIKLTFDDLDSDLKSYKYTILHCQADWTPSSDLSPIDYIDGFKEDNIEDFAYSFNTTVHYTHYSLIFPTPDLKPRLSGNYLLSVYTDDPADPIFYWRFMVFESSSVGVVGTIHQANNIADRISKQQIEFTVNYNGMQIDNPGRNIKVVISQNDRLDNTLSNLKPSFTRGESLEYSNNDAISFDGCNEFRSFDIKSLIYQSERIRNIQNDEQGIQVNLLDDTRRTYKNYASEKDINGRMLIKSDDHAQNSELEADYVWVTFSLPYQTVLGNGQIYLLGALTNWQINENSLMAYNFDQKSYVKRLFLKQGYYEYLYLFKEAKTNHTDISFIEGNHWETENEYTIWVYYQATGDLFDRLIAVQNLNSLH